MRARLRSSIKGGTPMVPRRRARIAAQRWFAVGVGALVLLVVLAGGARGASYWTPSQTSTFQWELDSPIDQTADAQVYDVDLFTTDASVVSSLHAQGRHVICYLDAGSWENWRPDAGKFPKSVLGNTYAGYADERWLDIRQLSILEPIMTARIQLCHDKGFDGVEFDNIDGWQNKTGFTLTSQDSITYDEWLASTAHSYNLNAAMKSDLDQVTQLEPYFDWNLDEECFDYSECPKLLPFIADHKAVLEVEYNKAVGQFCSKANGYGFMAMRKTEALTAWRAPCWATGNWVGANGLGWLRRGRLHIRRRRPQLVAQRIGHTHSGHPDGLGRDHHRHPRATEPGPVHPRRRGLVKPNCRQAEHHLLGTVYG